MSSFEDQIRGAYPELSASFTRLADYLLDYYPQAAFLTATELAHTLDLDPATVVRFAQRLGYPGYPQLQAEIQGKVKRELLSDHHVEPNTPAQAAEQALAQLAGNLARVQRTFPFDEAEALISALDEAQKVILLCDGLGLAPTRSLAASLEASGTTVHLASGSPAELALALTGGRRGDLVIGVEISDETPFIGRALEEARKAGLRTAALVAAPSATGARHADLVLVAHPSPEPGVGQIVVEALVFALGCMLVQARPGRFRGADERARALTRRLASASSD